MGDAFLLTHPGTPPSSQGSHRPFLTCWFSCRVQELRHSKPQTFNPGEVRHPAAVSELGTYEPVKSRLSSSSQGCGWVVKPRPIYGLGLISFHYKCQGCHFKCSLFAQSR